MYQCQLINAYCKTFCHTYSYIFSVPVATIAIAAAGGAVVVVGGASSVSYLKVMYPLKRKAVKTARGYLAKFSAWMSDPCNKNGPNRIEPLNKGLNGCEICKEGG